jgi:hypothetical protein
LAPTVGIAAIGFCYPGGIHQSSTMISSSVHMCYQREKFFFVKIGVASPIKTDLADSSSPSSFVIDKTNQVASSQLIFFNLFPAAADCFAVWIKFRRDQSYKIDPVHGVKQRSKSDRRSDKRRERGPLHRHD